MNINWYPGHMKKTIEDIEKKLKLVDFVIEIIDSRIPYSSRNPLFDELLKNKKRLLIFNKSDLSDPKLNEEWMKKLTDENNFAISYNATKPNVNIVVKKAEDLMSEEIKKYEEKGLKKGPLRAMIVGIPNSGKSTFINSISGTKSAKTGNRPGVTKTNQWIKIHPKLHLLDTPGVLWPKFDEKTGLNLSYTHAIKDEILNVEDLTLKFLEDLQKTYPESLTERYGVDPANPALEIYEDIARKRGAVTKGGDFDYTRTANIILTDFRSGKLGRISLERPWNILYTMMK